MAETWQNVLKKIDAYRWEIPRSYKKGMRVPGLIFAGEQMLDKIWEDQASQQVANVAFLPGIVGFSLAMPDIHQGYGFPIGGVAATRVEDGVVSPGGVGFDINCGVRLLRTNLTGEEVKPHIDQLVSALFASIPSGVGSEGRIKLTERELDRIMVKGGQWAVEAGYGEAADITVTEQSGAIPGADPNLVSERAKKRGIPQLGTLGSGNHFIEVDVVAEVYEAGTAKVMGIEAAGQVLLQIHTGSRGLGHEVCTDYVRTFGAAVRKYGIELPDRQLACAPVNSPEGKAYLAAMACAANYAWANRQCIAHQARESFMKVFSRSPRELGMEQVYDIAHNIAMIEEHTVSGKRMTLCVHRKGATRAFPGGHRALPEIYRSIGQPVLIPGDMGRSSYVSVGTELAMKETFGSICHGAGRVMSRSAAKRSVRGADLVKQLAGRGITVKSGSMSGLAEEASVAYKDVNEVVEVTCKAGIARKVVKMIPIGVIKG
ncbi:MAG: RtcB family protein [Chloroflexota bacterium]